MRAFLIFIFSTILSSAQQTPSEFMTSWVAEYNKNDAKAIVSYYDRSEDTDCLVSVGMWLKGFKEIEQMYHQDMKAIHFYDSKAEGMKHRILGDAAVVSFIHKFKYLIKDTEERYRIHIRTTATLRKDKDSWKIVSEHSSPIKGIERAKIIQREQAGAQNP
jgi:uncharacterized protein (TIGR02246 family)